MSFATGCHAASKVHTPSFKNAAIGSGSLPSHTVFGIVTAYVCLLFLSGSRLRSFAHITYIIVSSEKASNTRRINALMPFMISPAGRSFDLETNCLPHLITPVRRLHFVVGTCKTCLQKPMTHLSFPLLLAIGIRPRPGNDPPTKRLQ